jgi:hypothetical protein
MAKNQNKKPESAPRKNKGASTLVRKARKVLQSNGLHFFKEWANNASSKRPSLKVDNTKVYKQLTAKGESMNRRMDRPPVKKPEPTPEA